jgi:hypothetical protein
MNEIRPEVQQVTVTLPYFLDCVPMLYTCDGTPYIPMIELCRLLGLRVETHLSHWRKMPLWKCARKLPLQTHTGGKQLVWCLHIGALPFWYCTLNSADIAPERREQLQQAKDDFIAVPDIIYREKLRRQRQLQRFLLYFLTTHTDTSLFLEQVIQQVAPLLNEENRVWLEELISQGQEIISEALIISRKILHEQEKFPAIATYQSSHNDPFFEIGTPPLLPTILTTSVEDQQHFSRLLALLREWYQDLVTFLKEQRRK